MWSAMPSLKVRKKTWTVHASEASCQWQIQRLSLVIAMQRSVDIMVFEHQSKQVGQYLLIGRSSYIMVKIIGPTLLLG
jgi:hypothetical protein